MTCPPLISPGLCGVVVTYNPDPLVLVNLAALRPQVAELVVVDNTEGLVPECLREGERSLQINIVRMGRNEGIATALNRGLDYASNAGFPWAATFDQDSTALPGFAAGLNAALGACEAKERVALISPVHCDTEEACHQVAGRTEATAVAPITAAMTSGSVLRTDAFKAIGPYDEKLFIDYVDYEWCLRARRQGWVVMQARGVPLLHRLGRPKRSSLLGIPVQVKSHSAWRRYYIMRNRVLLYRRHAAVAPGWAVRDFGWIFLEFAKMLLFEDAKFAKLTKACQGLVHGALGRTGRVVEPGS